MLAQLNSEMGQIYLQALKSQNNSGTLMNEQRQWLSLRDSRCGFGDPWTIRNCLIQMTRGRISGLAAVALIQTEQPVAKADDKKAIEPDVAPLTNQAVLDPKEPSAIVSQVVDEATASKVLVESIQSLLGASRTENVKFFKYNVDKKELQGFKSDMPVLRIVYEERVFFDTDKDDPSSRSYARREIDRKHVKTTKAKNCALCCRSHRCSWVLKNTI